MRYITQMSDKPGYRLRLYDLFTGKVVGYYTSAEVAEGEKERLNIKQAQEDAKDGEG